MKQPHWLHTVLASSLTHFLLFGGLVFWLTHKPMQDATIRISSKRLHLLYQVHARKLGLSHLSIQQRAEVKARLVQDELLYREGLRLGLDKVDHIVKQRLVQKVLFLEQQLGGGSGQVLENDLQAYFQKTRIRWKHRPSLHFVHVFVRHFDKQRLQQLRRKVLQWERAHRSGVPRFGDLFLAGNEVRPTSITKLKQEYGSTFVKACRTLSVGQWSTPVSSRYGWHLVKLLRRTPGRPMTFSEAREKVLYSYQLVRKQRIHRQLLLRLRQRYHVEFVP